MQRNPGRSALAAILLALMPVAHAQQTWTSADGAISFTFPAGWESVESPDQALFYELYEDGEVTANCYAEGYIFENTTGQTQADYNAHVAASTPDSLRLAATPTRFTTSRIVSGVTVLEYAYEQEMDGWPLDFSEIQFGIVRSDRTTALNLACVGPQPMSGRAKQDIRSIEASLQIKP